MLIVNTGGWNIIIPQSQSISWIYDSVCDLTRDPKFREVYTNDQLGAAIGGWSILNYNHLHCKYDIYRWSFTHEKGNVEDDEQGYSTGYLVLQYMSWWKSTQSMEICKMSIVHCESDFLWLLIIVAIEHIWDVYLCVWIVHRIALLCGRTSSSMCCHQTWTLIENCFLSK